MKVLPFATARTAALDDAMTAMLELMAELREGDTCSEKHVGVSTTQLRMLCAARERDGQSVNDIAAALHVHQSSMSPQLVELLRKKLIRRTVAVDRRKTTISLTAAGRRLTDVSSGVGRPLLLAGLSKLTEKGLTDFAVSLRRLTVEMAVLRTKSC